MSLPLHPAIVHVPLGLAFVLPLVALGVALAVAKGALPRRAWLVVVLLQAIALGGALVARQTGEMDEDRAERRVSERLIEDHEERADAMTVALAIGLCVAGATALVKSPRLLRGGLATSVAASLVVAGLAAWTGHAGGRLVHDPAVVASGTVGGAAHAAGDRAAPPREKDRDGSRRHRDRDDD